MAVYLEQSEIREYISTQKSDLKEKGYDEIQINGILSLHYTKDMIVKYSEAEQDMMLDYWLRLIQEVDGGYWQIQELIQQPHSEFTHYTMRNIKSYEKGNVSKQMAKRELSTSAYNSYCERLEKAKVYKQIEDKV